MLLICQIRWYCARWKSLAPCLRARIESRSLAGVAVQTVLEELEGGWLLQLQPCERL